MPPPLIGRRTTLTDIFSDLLVLGFHLKQARDLGTVESIRIRLEQMLQAADQRGVEHGIPRDTLVEARYGVVAFLDEMVLGSRWDRKDEWAARSLQYQYFGANVAGEEFFSRLESLRRALPYNPDVLEVYHLCLVLGFEGKYKFHEREKLKDLMNDLFREIQGRRGEIPLLSPHSARPEELIKLVKQELPVWVIAASSVAIVFFFYVALSVLMSQEGTSVVNDLNQLRIEITR